MSEPDLPPDFQRQVPARWNRGCLVGLSTCLILFGGCAGYVLHYLETRKDRELAQTIDDLKSGRTDHVLLVSTRDTDAMLERLRGMSQIKSIHFEDTDVTLVGMKHLGTLPNLEWVMVYGGGPGFMGDGILELRK